MDLIGVLILGRGSRTGGGTVEAWLGMVDRFCVYQQEDS